MPHTRVGLLLHTALAYRYSGASSAWPALLPCYALLACSASISDVGVVKAQITVRQQQRWAEQPRKPSTVPPIHSTLLLLPGWSRLASGWRITHAAHTPRSVPPPAAAPPPGSAGPPAARAQAHATRSSAQPAPMRWPGPAGGLSVGVTRGQAQGTDRYTVSPSRAHT